MKWKKLMLPMVIFGVTLMMSISSKAASEDNVKISFDFSSALGNDGYLTAGSRTSAGPKMKYTVSSQINNISVADFVLTSDPEDEQTVYELDNAGKIVFTVLEGQDTNKEKFNISSKNVEIKGPNYDNLINVTVGTKKRAVQYDELRRVEKAGYAKQSSQYVFVIKPDGTNKLVVAFYGEDEKGNEDSKILYKAKFQYEIKVPDTEYIVKSISTSSANGFITATGLAKSEISFDGAHTFTIKPERRIYNSSLDNGFKFIPRYAYGASGVGAAADGSFTTNGEQVTEEGYHFEVENGNGRKKEYIVKVDMPFSLNYIGFNTGEQDEWTIAKIYDNGIAQSIGMQTVFTLNANDTISVALNLPERRVLSEVELREKDGKGDVIQNVEINEGQDGFSFVMPRSAVKVTKLNFVVDTSPRYKITSSVAVKDSREEAEGCYVLVQANGTAVAESIKKGTQITLTAKTDGQGSDSRLHDYKFDHWENVDALNLTEEQKNSDTITFVMPEGDLSVKAVYVHDGTKLTVGTTHRNGGTIQLLAGGIGTGYNNIALTNDGEGGVSEDYYHPATYQILLKGYNPEGYTLKGWLDGNGRLYDTASTLNGVTWSEAVDTQKNRYICPTVDLTVAKNMTFIASFEPKTACNLTVEPNDSKMGSATASLGETAITAGTTLYDGQTITLKAVPNSAKYIFKEWKLTKPESGVTVTFANPESVETTFVMPAVSGGQMTIQAVFIENPNYQSEECTLSDVELLKSDGTLVKKANKETVDNVTTFTVQLSPKEMTKDETAKLTSNAYKLRLTYSNKATAKKDGGYDDNDGADKWSDGIFNPISVGSSGTFIITAQNTNFKQKYTIAIAYDDRPLLTAGAVNRISDTEATVDFTSSSAGSYYYAVVEKGAAEPTIDTSGVGVGVKANKAVTISLKSLTAGAKDIYIKVKNDDKYSDVKISDTLKITIPDYDPDKTGYTIETPQSPGGTISVDKKVAKEGELVTVTVTPDAGKQIKPDGLRYSQSGPPYEVVKIDTKTKQFKMPAYDISVSCTFVNADTVTTDGPAISAFIVNGVSGSINDTTGTITVTLPYGTDLTALKPAITLKGAVSVSPVSGEKVDLSSSKTYTVTAEDGTTKTYTVTAYTEAQPTSDKLWEDMLNHIGGNTGNTGKNTWWQKAKDMKKNNNYPKYW